MEFDFEVYKALTAKRRSESHGYNDVLRELLGLSPAAGTKTERNAASAAVWVSKGVQFPEGTNFRCTYKGTPHMAKVVGGRLLVDGKSPATSLSAAARLITNNAVDGWAFWEVLRPDERDWKKAQVLRSYSSVT